MKSLLSIAVKQTPSVGGQLALPDSWSCTSSAFLLSHKQTPLVSEHLAMFSATYKHYIFNLR